MNPDDPYGEGCNPLVLAPEQPHGIEHFTADGVYIRQGVVAKAETLIPQHSHRYGHFTMLAKGSMRVWADDKLLGDFKAPTGVFIKANVKHKLLTLEDDTVFYCIHNTARTGKVEIAEEHHLNIGG